MKKPTLLFYCQHSLGMGHLVRSFRLAEALGADFRTVFVNGGLLPSAPPVPPDVEIEQLAPIGMRPEGGLISKDPALDLESAKRARRERLLTLLSTYRPSVLLVELFPFGRRKFADELIPLLDAAKAMERPPLILCSLRDLLVQHPTKQRQHERFATTIVNAYVDAVLIHADPAFARLEESFTPSEPLGVDIHYTGFVAPGPTSKKPVSLPGTILVSAGSGTVGAPLFQAALEAQPVLLEKTGLAMTLIAGPFLDDEIWSALRSKTEGRSGLTLLRSVPDMAAELGHAAASISQCGYNTVMDILSTPLPALVVPFFTPKENEQINRAKRLHELGIVRLLHPGDLNGQALVANLVSLLQGATEPTRLNLNGAHGTARLVQSLAKDQRSHSALRDRACIPAIVPTR
ncbi:MAG: hypothetical protein OEU92_29105 [Alphaproteobacteria bacterium]|nr:hypothetical protein [Alphaproteobacteria bacterium]